MDEVNGVIPLSASPLRASSSSYPQWSLHCPGSAAELQPSTGGCLGLQGLYSHCSPGLCWSVPGNSEMEPPYRGFHAAVGKSLTFERFWVDFEVIT